MMLAKVRDSAGHHDSGCVPSSLVGGVLDNVYAFVKIITRLSIASGSIYAQRTSSI